MSSQITLNDWWDNVSEEAKPTVLQLLNVVVNQSSNWLMQWADYFSKGQVAEAYQMAFEAMTADNFLSQGDNITAQWKSTNADNVSRIEAQRQAVFAIMTFGITAIKEAIPLLLAAL